MSDDLTSPLQVGDRVQRVVSHVLDADQPVRVGTVSAVYQSARNAQGSSMTLYAVEWDHLHYEERGYMRHGLVKIGEEKVR